MNLIKIVSIMDAGIAQKERLYLRAFGLDNLGRYLVFSTHETVPGSIFSRPSDVFWFPDQEVKTGDHIFLYTGYGANAKFRNNEGTINHFYYWKCQKTVWNSTNSAAALLNLNSWEYKKRS